MNYALSESWFCADVSFVPHRHSLALIMAIVHSWRRYLKSTSASCASISQKQPWNRFSHRCAPLSTRSDVFFLFVLFLILFNLSWHKTARIMHLFPYSSSHAHFLKDVQICVQLSAMRSWSVATPSWAPFAATPLTCCIFSWRVTSTTQVASRLSGRTYRWDNSKPMSSRFNSSKMF